MSYKKRNYYVYVLVLLESLESCHNKNGSRMAYGAKMDKKLDSYITVKIRLSLILLDMVFIGKSLS